jgi:4-amino-4-deoxy-L-arabinose transferase-like glycosyltransferase
VRARVSWPWIALFAATKLAVTMSVSNRYGWHGDELYFIAASRHVDLGYVDFPPIVPLLAAADQAVAPGSLVALRLLAALAGCAVLVLTALIARELGASTRAQAWAALALLLSPVFLGANALFHTASFDQLAWAAAILVFVRLLRTDDHHLWLVIGLVVGIGLETKHTMVALPPAMIAGLLATNRRSMLLTPWPWLGAAVALLVFLPNLVWQATHDWISVQYVLSHRGHTDGPFAYWWQQALVFINPVFLVPVAMGLFALRKDERFGAMTYVFVAVLLIFFVAGGKSYYAAPIYPLGYAAGAMWLDQRLRRKIWIGGLAAASAAVTLVLATALLPIAPVPNSTFADEVGWPELAQQTALVYDSLTPDERANAVILAHYYSQAAAIDFYGPALGLPHAVSPHLSYWYWAPARMNPSTVVMVNFTLEEGNELFTNCSQVGTVTNSIGLHNNTYGAPILVCSNPRRPLWQVWRSLQTLD